MRYYNQTNYPHVPYPTLTDLPELGRSDTTVRDAGCGLCASCMVVENMTGREFPLIDCLELSINVNANHSPGTDLTVLGPYIAERFDLDLVITDDPELLRAHLKKGYMAVACSAGDRPEELLALIETSGKETAAPVKWLSKFPEGRKITVSVPGSKSITNRALLLAAPLLDGPCHLQPVLA